MADVFLSYARPSADRAKQVASALRQQGFTVWFDENLLAHKPYAEVIETELDSAAAVLVLWSEPAIASQWVRSEANRARETGRLVQARLDSARIPMPFDQIQCADLSHWTGRIPPPGWQSVVASIAALANRNAPKQISGAHGRSLLAGRRSFLISGMAVGGMAFAGFAGWQVLSSRDNPSAEAQLLLQRA